MTVLPFRPARLLLAGCLLAAHFLAGAADDNPLLNNQFTAPTYQGLTQTPRGTTGSNNGNGGAGQDLQGGNAQRPLQNNPPNSRNGNGNANGNGNGQDTGNFRPYLPPPKPGEFQKFVETATGRLLPIFGSTFFSDAYNSYAPVDNVPVPADYTVGPGDEVILRAWGSIDVDYRTTVDRNGLLNLPKVGSFNVSGVKASDLEKSLRSQIGRLYTNFDLSVSLGQLRGLKVFVVGPAVRPGVLTLPSQSTLLAAVVMAGGPSPSGSMRKVLLKRDGKVVSELDMYAFLVQGDKSRDVQLAAGDVVVFEPAGPRVAINGALDTPSIFELRAPQEPVRQVLRYAGGAPSLANPNLAQLERIDVVQKAARFVEEFKLDAVGLDKTLRDGDVLTLLPISPQFANAVTLRGHVAQPLRYPYTPGMRIRDLIPDREALITPDFYRRKNLLVQAIDDDEDTGRGRNYVNNAANRSGPAGYGASNTGSGRGNDDSNAPNANGYGAAGRNAGNYGAAAAYDNRNGNNNGNGSNGNNANGYNNDAYASDNDNDMQRTRAERSRRRDDRAVVNASKRAPTPLFDELNWEYAVIERLNRNDLTTQVIPFNLGKAVLQGDETSNVVLMPGDVVTIYSQKDIQVPVSRQTRLVSLEGEVAAPGVYQLQPGDTLQSVIARAGGFSAQAYVYGLEFSREETRVRQRENLTAAIARLEALSAVQAARDAANRRDDAQGALTTTAVSNAATQAQLARLRNIQPNGRIALELDPEVNTLASLPEVPLEGGDRILVPPRPGFVTVAGAVVNSNAFLWRPGRTAGEYLRLAGADEAAEPANMFILRADGTVSHAADSKGWFGRNNLEKQVMQPGDALIVPNQLDFETWGRAFVRNLKDFAQIFTGFGIGIAAIHSLDAGTPMKNEDVRPVIADLPEDDGPSVSLTELLTWLGEGKRLVAAATIALAVVAAGAAFLMPKVYTAHATVLPPGSQQQSGSAAALAALGSLGGLVGGAAPKSPDEFYVALLKSDSVVHALDDRFGLKARYEAKNFEGLRKAILKYVKVTSDKKSGLITIDVEDEDPKFAADLANAHQGEVTKVLGRLAVSEAQLRRVFFERQMNDTKENLIKAEQHLRDVQEKSGVIVLDKQAEALITSAAQLRASIAEREVQLKVLRTSATDQNPDVIRLNSELRAMRAELARMDSRQGGDGSAVDIPVGKLPEAGIEYVRARRELKLQETLLESMVRQFEGAKLDEAKEGQSLQQVDVALPPDQKSGPARTLITLGAAVLGFLLSAGYVVIRRYNAWSREQFPEDAAARAALSRAWRWRG